MESRRRQKADYLFGAIVVILIIVIIAVFLLAVNWKPPSFGSGGSSTGPKPLSDYSTGHVHTTVTDPSNPNRVYTGTHEGLFFSDDGGKTYLRLEGTLAREDVMGFVVDPADSQTLYASGHSIGVMHSSDGGKVWHPRSQGIPSQDVHGLSLESASPPRLRAEMASGQNYVSSDWGESWIEG